MLNATHFNRLNRTVHRVAVALALLPCASVLAGPPTYRVFDLAALRASIPGGEVTFSGLNDSNDLAGTLRLSAIPNPNSAVVSYGLTTPIDIGALTDSYIYQTQANALNNAGQVLGAGAYGREPTSNEQAFVLWTPQSTGLLNIGILPGATLSYALAINEHSQIVGTSNGIGGYKPIYWSLTTGLQTLVPGATGGAGEDINNSGLAVGYFGDGSGEHAFTWSQAAGVRNIPLIPGSGSVSFHRASGVNDHGLVTGFQVNAGSPANRLFIWTETDGTRPLGNLPGETGNDYSYAYDINNHGFIIGRDGTDAGETIPFFWSEDVGMVRLQGLLDPADQLSASTVILGARRINNADVILADALINGFATQVLLVPVPEVSTGTLLLVGLGVLGVRLRQTRG